MTRCSIVALFGVLLCPLASYARWEGAQDNKPRIELQGMNNEQLFNEAFDVCVRRALLEDASSESGEPTPATESEASDYLSTIYPYVRERNGGTMPTWMNELFTAHTTKACQQAFRTFVANNPPTPRSAPEASDHKRKPQARRHTATPGPNRSEWSEQLPPWLAPQ